MAIEKINSRQTWLNSLSEGDEVAVDFRTQGKGCRVYRVQKITSTDKHKRVFQVNGMLFSPSGGYICDNGMEYLPSHCCLEDPDSANLGWGSQPTRREVSERWNAQHTLRHLLAGLNEIPTDKMIAMIKVFLPDYKPEW